VFQIVSRQEKSGKKAGVHAVVLVKISGRNQWIAGIGEKLKVVRVVKAVLVNADDAKNAEERRNNY
jgi:hypothetical protein